MSNMSEMLWAKQQMDLRKMANQFLARLRRINATRILITSVQKGDGKARFIQELAGEIARVQQKLIPLHAANLEFVNPDRFESTPVIVYGPSYTESSGLHTIPERWMRSFDAAVILVMLRRTRQRELLQLVSWLKEYNIENIWPVVNELKTPTTSQFWNRMKTLLRLSKAPEPPPRITAVAAWAPLLGPARELAELPAAGYENDDDFRSKSDESTEKGSPLKTDVVIVEERNNPPPPGKTTDGTDSSSLRSTQISSPPPSSQAAQIQVTNFSETLKERRFEAISSSTTPPAESENTIEERTEQVFSARRTIRSSVPPAPARKTSIYETKSEPPPGDKKDTDED